MTPTSLPRPRASVPPQAPAGDERALLRGLVAGEPEACETLVRSHGPRMLAVAKRILRDDSAAQEAVQEAFISAFRSIGRFEGDSKLGTWLHRIVVNAALMQVRSRERLQEESLDELLPAFLPDGHHASAVRPWALDAETLLAAEQTRALVRECIDRLPENHRVVLVLRDIEELDTEETAKVLGVNTNVVKIRLHRARQALRTLLEPHLLGDRS